jgi:TonB dependent receptor/CarboxypepD_reg-like domain/TonB-dependent Receptor Plug Domain
MKIVYLLLILLFSTSFLQAQNIVQGVVLDKTTKKALPFTSVSIENTPLSTSTNEAGFFYFKNIESGNYKIIVSYLGYNNFSQDIQITNDSKTSLIIDLEAGTMLLEEVAITSPNAHKQQIINKIDINLRPLTNAQEILRLVPGLFIGQHAGGGKAEQIFLRGFDIDHGTDIRLTVDDMPVNMVSHAHGQGYADLHFVIPELVELVDFKKGMYHADKGNFSTAGWVNFHTKDALENNMVKIEGGQFNTYRGFAAMNLLGEKARQKEQSAYVATEYNYSDSYFDSPQKFNRLNIFGKYYGKISDNTYLKITGSHFNSKWNHSGQIPDRAIKSGLTTFYGAIDDTEGGETSRSNVNAEITTNTRNGGFIKNQFYYSKYDFELYSNFTFFLEDSLNGDQIKQKESRNILGYNGLYRISNYISGKKAETTFGVQYRQDFTKNTELSHTLNRTQVIDPIKLGDITEANIGFYIDETINMTPQLNMNIGVRYDYFKNIYLDKLENNTKGSAKAGSFFPKLNLYFTPNKKYQFYINIGRGFHSNDTRVVVPQGGKEILPAAYGADLGMIWKPVPRLFINTALWYLALNQEFVYVGDAGVVEPSGKTRRMGFDVSARYQLTSQLFADFDANWTQPRAKDAVKEENYLPLAPIFTSIGGLSLYNKSGFNGSLRYRFMANRPANEDYSITAKGYFVTDFQLNYTKKSYNLGLSIYNLFNKKWKETQFATESRLKNEMQSVEEIHFTAGSPFFAKMSFALFF